jgi:hypothetical protein
MNGTWQAFYPSAAEFQYRVLGMTYSHIINNRIYNAGSIETLMYERRESTAKWRMLSLVFLFLIKQ